MLTTSIVLTNDHVDSIYHVASVDHVNSGNHVNHVDHVDPVDSVDHVDSGDHVDHVDHVDSGDFVDHVDHVDYVNYQVDSINHNDHALNFPATANMQREEKKRKERSIYSGELVFEIKKDFIFSFFIKSFSFLLFLLIGRMDSIPMKMIQLTKI